MTAAVFVSHGPGTVWCRGRGGVFVPFGVVGAFFVAPCGVVCDLFLCVLANLGTLCDTGNI